MYPNNWKLLIVLFLTFSIQLNAQIEEDEIEEDMPVFEDNTVIDEKDIPITWPKTNDTVRWKQKNKYGFVCNKTEVLIPFEYYDLPQKFAPVMIAKKDGKTGVINNKNETLIPFEYSDMRYYKNGFMVYNYENRKKKYGMLDLEGKVLLPLIYDSTGPVNKGTFFNGQEAAFVAKTDDPVKSLYFNITGDLIFEVPYRQYAKIGEHHIRVIAQNYKHGLLNLENETVLECKYHHIFWVKDDIAAVSTGKYMKLIRLEDESIYHNKFTNYKKPDQHNNIIASTFIDKKKHHAVLNLDGREIHPLEHALIYYLEESNIYAKRIDRKLVAVFDPTGNPIPEIDPVPDNILALRHGFYATMNKEKQWRVFNNNHTLFREEKFRSLRAVDPRGRKFPAGVDMEKLIAIVTTDDYEDHYLYSTGEMVKR